MAKPVVSPLSRQVAKVRRRLIVQSLLNHLALFWAGAMLLSAGWFLAEPFAVAEPALWLRWAVAGGLFGLGTVLGIVLGIVRSPSQLFAALSLDSHFGLKERVTSSLTLSPELAATGAGQALLADVNQKITGLDVGSKFPLRMAWHAALVPVFACLLALIAVFYKPTQGHAKANIREDLSKAPANASEIEQKLKELAKKPTKEKVNDFRDKSEELQRLEAELEKIANKPHENKEQVRERIKEMTALEEEMKAKEKEMSDKSRSLKEQLKKIDQQQAGQKDNEGPAKDLNKALKEGNFEKAREEIERLTKNLKKGEMTAKEKEQLQKQLENLEKKLERAASQKDKEEQLKKANLDPETLKREMENLKREAKKSEGLKDLAKAMGKCKEALKENDMEMASEQMSKAGDKLKDMEASDGDLDDLRDQLKRLQDAKDSC